MHRLHLPYLVALGLAAAACGSTGTHAARTPLDVTLETSEREPLQLSEFRGRPLLVLLLATFDDASQLALGAVVQARAALDDTPQVVGIALQPNPRPFLASYGDALAVDFPLTYEPDGHILAGRTALGAPISVPTLVLLDAAGGVVEIRIGVPTAREVVELLQTLD